MAKPTGYDGVADHYKVDRPLCRRLGRQRICSLARAFPAVPLVRDRRAARLPWTRGGQPPPLAGHHLRNPPVRLGCASRSLRDDGCIRTGVVRNAAFGNPEMVAE